MRVSGLRTPPENNTWACPLDPSKGSFSGRQTYRSTICSLWHASGILLSPDRGASATFPPDPERSPLPPFPSRGWLPREARESPRRFVLLSCERRCPPGYVGQAIPRLLHPASPRQ